MKRRAISGVLFLGFLFNVLYCAIIGVVAVLQEDIKLDHGCAPEVAAQMTFPVMYFLFALITLLMQLVLVMNFSNSMRFETPTLWIEAVSIVLYGGVFRVFYHYIPELDARFAQFRGVDALSSRMALNEIIQGLDWIFALSSACFLVGAGMTICFKKFVRYFCK